AGTVFPKKSPLRHKVSSFFEEHFCAIPRKFKLKSHFATDTNYVLGLIEWFIEQRQCDLPEEGVKVPPIRKHKLAPKE
ncbi:MAG: hypothetical protein ACLQNE_33050, partial [Thermoguttaceae bacterium]